jgi:hypothetical protein
MHVNISQYREKVNPTLSMGFPGEAGVITWDNSD